MRTKIKLHLAMVVIALFIGANTFAQGLYINAGAGYGLPAAPHRFEENYNSNNNSPDQTYKKEIVKGTGSFGKGVQAGAVIGYMFNKNIGAELGISYLFGSKLEFKDVYNGASTTSEQESSYSAQMLRFTPSLKMAAGNGKVKPYLKTGLVIGTAGKIKATYKDTDHSKLQNVEEEVEAELTGGISIGFAGALGADYMLTDKIGIFAEIGIITQSWAPKKMEITKYIEGGQDVLDDMSTRDKETEFVDSYSIDYDNIDENSPNQQLKIYFPFSSVGINAGIRIALGGSSAAK